MRVLYFDCGCGASGDMIVGALIDAGAPFAKIEAGLKSLGVPGLEVSAERVVKHGIAATQFCVHAEGGHPVASLTRRTDVRPGERADHGHHHHHTEHHHKAEHHVHRRLADVLEIIERGELPDAVKAGAAETFRRIADAEASVHGTTPDKVHFHEVGAIDSIADIVGGHLALHLLGVDRVMASPLNVGSGEVKTAHGVLPVPAPATVLLLKGVPFQGSEIPFELVTPTGAALMAQWADAFGPMPSMTVESVGYGSGTRDVPGRANVLRALVGEAAEALKGGEPILILETDIDDMNPELFPPLMADVLAAGARDVFLTPILGKKGRPAHLMTVLCDEEKAEALARVIFRGSTTFGVRMRREQRFCLGREWKVARTAWGDVRVKVGRFQGEVTTASPEFEDCRAAAEAHGAPVRVVYEAAKAVANKGDLHDA